jgi:hypothetical protein
VSDLAPEFGFHANDGSGWPRHRAALECHKHAFGLPMQRNAAFVLSELHLDIPTTIPRGLVDIEERAQIGSRSPER